MQSCSYGIITTNYSRSIHTAETEGAAVILCGDEAQRVPEQRPERRGRGPIPSMKLFKSAPGRVAFVVIAIVLQVALFVLGVLRVIEVTFAIELLAGTVVVLCVVHLFNRDMICEAKLSWLFLIMFTPVFGAVVYMLFSNNRISKTERLVRERTERESLDYFEVPDAFPEPIPPLYEGQCRYIMRCCGTVPTAGKDVCYYPSGESFFNALLEELSFAKEYIFLEYFVISEGKMWNAVLDILKEKVKSGVEVRVMYDDLGCIPHLPYGYDEQLRSFGIKCVRFNRFRPVLSAVHNNRDHRKIAVIDGVTGFVGGANLADEYINERHPYGHWKDSAVRFRGRAVEYLTLMFLRSYDTQAGFAEEFSNYIPEYTEVGNDGIVLPYADGPRPIYDDYVAENVYLNIINQAQKTLYITTPYLIPDSKLTSALMIAARRGVDVRIVTPHIPDKKIVFQITRSHYAPLQRAGVQIYEYLPGFLHAKQFLCDGNVATVGTVNLDYRSLVHHYECGVWMYDTACIADIHEEFERIFSVSENMHGFQQGRFARVFCSVLAVFTPLL